MKKRPGKVCIIKTVLTGAFGTILSEESLYKQKPMIDINGILILWHIIKENAYYLYGFCNLRRIQTTDHQAIDKEDMKPVIT